MMFCSNCGKEITAGARFCGNCGKSVSAADVPAPVLSPVVPDAGTLLTQLKSVAKYKGMPAAGYSESTGTLLVYNDRLEFQKKGGNARQAQRR